MNNLADTQQFVVTLSIVIQNYIVFIHSIIDIFYKKLQHKPRKKIIGLTLVKPIYLSNQSTPTKPLTNNGISRLSFETQQLVSSERKN